VSAVEELCVVSQGASILINHLLTPEVLRHHAIYRCLLYYVTKEASRLQMVGEGALMNRHLTPFAHRRQTHLDCYSCHIDL
jgi:hypothetical protein